jgi:hypothetical protein
MLPRCFGRGSTWSTGESAAAVGQVDCSTWLARRCRPGWRGAGTSVSAGNSVASNARWKPLAGRSGTIRTAACSASSSDLTARRRARRPCLEAIARSPSSADEASIHWMPVSALPCTASMSSSEPHVLVAGCAEHQRNTTWPSEKAMPKATTQTPETPVSSTRRTSANRRGTTVLTEDHPAGSLGHLCGLAPQCHDPTPATTGGGHNELNIGRTPSSAVTSSLTSSGPPASPTHTGNT